MLLGPLSFVVAAAGVAELLSPLVWLALGEDWGLRLALAWLLAHAASALLLGYRPEGAMASLVHVPVTGACLALVWVLPPFVVFFFGRVLLQIVAPFEAFLVVFVTRFFSKTTVDYIDEYPALVKGAILGTAGTCYCGAIYLYYLVFSGYDADESLRWLTIGSIVLSVLLTTASVQGPGIITDPAVVTLYLSFVCLCMVDDTYTPPVPVSFTSLDDLWAEGNLSLLYESLIRAASVMWGLLSVKTAVRVAVRIYALSPFLVPEANTEEDWRSHRPIAVMAACLPSLMYTELVSAMFHSGTLLWTGWRALQVITVALSYGAALWMEAAQDDI